MPPLARHASERFWDKVSVQPDACWEWTTAIANGYGVIGAGGEDGGRLYAHRLSWEMHFGQLPPDMFVCHRCDNRRCVRPDHLFLGTQRDNIHDMIAKGRRRSGNHSGEANPRARLKAGAVRAIRERKAAGERTCNLAQEYGVHPKYILRIVNRKLWASVP